MTSAVACTILIPLAGAAMTALVGARGVRSIAALTIAGTFAAVGLTVHHAVVDGPVRIVIGDWQPPLGIELYTDGLALVMLPTIAVVAGLLATHALLRVRTHALASRFFALWFFAWAGLDALVLSSDVFNLYVTLELVTLAAVGLIAVGADHGALRAALRYLLIAFAGSLIYLVGVALLYARYATLELSLLGAHLESTPDSWLGLALVSLGLVLKAALFPLHAWLPPIYTRVRPVVGGMLAGLVGKAAFLVMAKLWWHVIPAAVAAAIGPLLGVLGGAAVVWGSLLALHQSRLKLVIAYSSVAQTGYLFLAFAVNTPAAWAGAVYIAISHALAAAVLFMTAGTIERTFGDDSIDHMRSFSERFPVAFFALALAGISLMGMPPTGGFTGKWLLVRAALDAGHWTSALVMVLGGLIAAAYIFRVLRRAFLPLEEPAPPRERSLGGDRVAFTLALLGVAIGLAPSLVLEALAIGGVG